jgi:two-component system LytT family response regulator
VKMRTIIVDDEELARRGMRARLEKWADVEIVAECKNGRQAIDAIRRTSPHLVFLDVQMPGKTGFDVIEALDGQPLPYIAFVTAYDQHAIRAFQVHALDYLLKPIDDARFEQTLDRARSCLARDGRVDFGTRVASLLEGLRPPEPSSLRMPDRLVIRSGGHVVFLRPAEVDWIEATGDYLTLHCGKKSWLQRATLTAIEEKLRHHGFARVHRSAIVNLRRISEMKSLDNGEFLVRLDNGTELKLSRSYRHILQHLVRERL